jgi:hypothetical protein
LAKTCSICVHPKRQQIERQLALRTSYRNIAKQFSVSTAPLSRHLPHFAERLSKIRDDEDQRVALDVVTELRTINGVALGILKNARDSDNPGLALKAIDRIHRQLELQAKLLGDMDDRPQINILIAPAVEQAIIDALRPFPEAGIAVSDAIAELESSGVLDDAGE